MATTSITTASCDVAYKIPERISRNGWKKYNVGESTRIDYNLRFDMYVRQRNMMNLTSKNDDILKMSSNEGITATHGIPNKIKGSRGSKQMVSKAPMGIPKSDLTPFIQDSCREATRLQDSCREATRLSESENLPVLSSFSDYPSLAALRTDKPAIVIAFDSEWYYTEDNTRQLLTR